MSRKRPHEIKIRLNDEELGRLNEMVARTIYDRETFLRLMLEGYTLRDTPREYKSFTWDLRRLASNLRLYDWNKSLSELQRQELNRLADQIWDFIHRLDEIYFPYFKEAETTVDP